MTYSEKLKDPRWQKKRLEVLARDEWKCRDCRSDKKTLHVHHHRYKSDANPWEYSNLDLGTFCDDCHEKRHRHLKHLKRAVQCFTSNLTAEQIERLHKGMMHKGAALDMLNKIVNGEVL